MKAGFTLIELSIVLVVIGLIVGGILVGQNLIQAAAARAQITQIERYQTAVRTFQGKYGSLPGDIADPGASSYGFQARGPYAGEGDGNGGLEGNCYNATGGQGGIFSGCGELAMFWQDLSTANLLDTAVGTGAGYPYATGGNYMGLTGTPNISNWIPTAKLGQGNFVYVYSISGVNYFSVSTVTQLGWMIYSTLQTPGVTVAQAYSIDSKIDDGLPQSGNVTQCYQNGNILVGGGNSSIYAAGGLQEGAHGSTNWLGGYANDCVPTTTMTPYATTNCYDNNNVTGTQKYSMQNANVANCALSVRFQ